MIKIDMKHHLCQIDANDVKIKYTTELPRIETKKIIFKDGYLKNWFSARICKKDEITIYIPKGSIMNNYNLDAQ